MGQKLNTKNYMEVKTEEIIKGLHNGKEVWICDYRFTDFDKKPIRNVKPTKVLIRPISETNKTIYYSNTFFSEIKKDKVVASSVIKLYDNTGFRSFPGVALNVFTTEKECLEKYRKQGLTIENEFEKWREDKISHMKILERDIQEVIMYGK